MDPYMTENDGDYPIVEETKFTKCKAAYLTLFW